MTRTVLVGQHPGSRFLAFGDDSQLENALVYAFLIVPRHEVSRLHRKLLLIKERFKIPASTAIHCRILMHHHAREKAGLGHLTDDAAKSVIGHIIRDVNRLKCILRYCHTALPLETPVQQATTPEMFQLPMVPKGILGILAQICFTVPPDGSCGPTANLCEIVVAEDRTKHRFMNQARSQAHNFTSGFTEAGAQLGEVFHIKPRIATASTEPMLEIADVLAYACVHTLVHQKNYTFFKEQVHRIERRSESGGPLNFGPVVWHKHEPPS